jgi:hypothetical protein
MGVDVVFDADERMRIADTPGQRAGAFAAYDGLVAMEARGHVNSDGRTWNERWLDAFRGIAEQTENPEVYVAYIVARRRAAGLPELEGGEPGRDR